MMPLFIEIDFDDKGRLHAWWKNDRYAKYPASSISGYRVREVLRELAKVIDPLPREKKSE
jgi:hypothetical protein